MNHSLPEGFSAKLSSDLVWQHLARLDSTNTYLLAADQPAGQLVSADVQTHGRGRRQQQWVDEGESALFSLAFAFPQGTDIGAWPVQVALTLAHSLNALMVHFGRDSRVKIKWPNDLYLERQGQWGKCAGILVETHVGREGKVVSGIGLNLAPIHKAVSEDYAPAFIDLPLAKKDLIAVLANQLWTAWQGFVNWPVVSPADYRQVDYLADADLIATDLHSGEQQRGTGIGINDRGQLLLAQSTGVQVLTSQQRIRFA
ncbi:MAG: biotin--[acetyl-CoA-carboxylase] ligase [Gammaproteobacteria bacterium]|nr:MAG: biotin--[acetyl-CoA-carboxylase] ligase [Gammaproteobacteria bacterium]